MKLKKTAFSHLRRSYPTKEGTSTLSFSFNTFTWKSFSRKSANQHVLINKLELHKKHCCSSSQNNAEYNSRNPKWPQTPQVTIWQTYISIWLILCACVCECKEIWSSLMRISIFLQFFWATVQLFKTWPHYRSQFTLKWFWEQEQTLWPKARLIRHGCMHIFHKQIIQHYVIAYLDSKFPWNTYYKERNKAMEAFERQWQWLEWQQDFMTDFHPINQLSW